MRAIGGYYELELNTGKEYHHDSLKLNLGRTAFEYILRAKKIQKVFIPYFTCDAVLEPLLKTGISYEFYKIDINFEPSFDYSLINEFDYFLYINYFGIKDEFIKRLVKKVKNLIVDNSQAFFSKPNQGIDTFYSPRKFFGVPDGGYLYTNKILNKSLDKDRSENRFNHLIERIENGAEDGYPSFRKNEDDFSGQPIRQMSNVTQRILQSINYSKISKKRNRNFKYIHDKLGSKNLLNFNVSDSISPMVYPFFIEHEIRETLIKNKIFVPRYWPNVTDWCNVNSIEYKFSELIVSLPIDQRYTISDMKKLVSIINSLI